MRRSLIYFTKLILYWLLFFSLYRVCFILIYSHQISGHTFLQGLIVFYHSFRLDMATIGYMILFPFVMWVIQQFFKDNFLNHIHYVYHIILISASTLLCISTIALYGEWNTLINYNTLHYLISPSKMFPYLSTWELVAVAGGAALVITLFILLFRLLILMVIPYSTRKPIYKIAVIPIAIVLLIVMMRGGFKYSSINEKSAFFSPVKFYDQVSVNPVWHLSYMTALAIKANTNDEPK
jgi:hypothetical protein